MLTQPHVINKLFIADDRFVRQLLVVAGRRAMLPIGLQRIITPGTNLRTTGMCAATTAGLLLWLALSVQPVYSQVVRPDLTGNLPPPGRGPDLFVPAVAPANTTPAVTPPTPAPQISTPIALPTPAAPPPSLPQAPPPSLLAPALVPVVPVLATPPAPVVPVTGPVGNTPQVGLNPQPANPAPSGRLLANTTPPPSAKLVEIKADPQALLASMRILNTSVATGTVPSGSVLPAAGNPQAAQAQGNCSVLVVKADVNKPGMSLLDLSGNGLIVMSRPTAQVLLNLQQEGYQFTSLNQSISVCLRPVAFRQMTGTTPSAAQLVQTPQGFELMSAAQWQQYQLAQLSTKPSVTAASARNRLSPTKRLSVKNKVAVLRKLATTVKLAAG
jgi:hypothetical protein